MSKTITMSVYDAMEQQKEINELRKENKKLKQNIKTLELRLDNKDKLLEEYRKKIDKLKQHEALQLIKSGEPPATLADMERYGNKINKINKLSKYLNE